MPAAGTGGADGGLWKRVVTGVQDIRHYGAVPDDPTKDCADAIEVAIQASGRGAAAPAGGIVYIPPGTYYCGRNIDILRQVTIRGSNGGGFYSALKIVFAFGCGFVFHTAATAASLSLDGNAEDSTVEDLAFEGSDPPPAQRAPSSRSLKTWDDNTPGYVHGDRVRVEDDNRFYWECIAGGVPGATAPFESGLDSTEGKGLGLEVPDGACTWLCKSSSAITAFARIHVRRCFFFAFHNAAVIFYGTNTLPPASPPPFNGSNVNAASCCDCYFQQCGVGIHITGNNNANSIRLIGNYILTSGAILPAETGGVGIVDDSFLGSHCYGNDIEYSTGPWIYGTSTYPSTYIANYSEAGQHPARVNGLVLGGMFGTGFDSASAVSGFVTNHWLRLWSRLDDAAGRPIVRWDVTHQRRRDVLARRACSPRRSEPLIVRRASS